MSARDYQFYIDSMLPLFKMTDVDMLEFACSLLRAGGPEDKGWDSLDESRAMLGDLVQLNKLELPSKFFVDPERTHWRLHLLSYVHLTEMNAVYHVIANLLRVRNDLKYSRRPFGVFENASRKKRVQAASRAQAAMRQTLVAPHVKIEQIKALAHKAGLAGVGHAFDSFYFSPLRNAIAHSDYVLHDNELRLINQRIPDEKNPKVLTSVLSYERLGELIARAYDFYTAFFTLESVTRSEFDRISGKPLAYEQKLKGILEFLVDDHKSLNGFKIHWPNRTESTYMRADDGCKSRNIVTAPDGTLNFLSGKIVKGSPARYTPLSGRTRAPEWPSL